MTPNAKPGDKIRIREMKDPYRADEYAGREGTVIYIDAIGQLHGTWGGLAIIPGVDDYTVIEEAK